ncbi:MAG: hypothetical protein K5776_06530 [Lachnospiraceae bacterium]|nr:hypothetical protein [Lachnospiraceae bacterium]
MYTIEDLVERLQECVNIQKQQQEIIGELQAENNLLSSTITNKELGKINEERRSLQQKMFICESRQRKAEQDLQDFQNEYSADYNELQERLNDVKSKQGNIRKYITGEAKKIIKDKEAALEREYKQKQRVLDAEYKEKETVLFHKITFLKKTVFALCVVITVLLIIMISR